MAKKSSQPDDTPLSKRLRELAEKVNLTRDQLMRMSLLPTDKEQTIMEMVAEGNALIEADEAKTTNALKLPGGIEVRVVSEKPEVIEALNKDVKQANNPYFQARMTVLGKYPEWRRNEINNMEKEGNLSNRFYADFVTQVSTLGDKLSQ